MELNLKSINAEVSPDQELVQQFKVLAEATAALLQKSGLKVKGYRDASLPHYSLLTTEIKRRVLKQIQFFHDLCVEQVEEGYSIKDTHSFTWRALQSIGVTPTSNLFNSIGDDNIVEIYSSEGLQLFRNFRFFEFCSYSLEEMYSAEWWMLYQRDERVMAELLDIDSKIRKGDYPEGMVPKVGPHIVREIRSEEKLEVLLTYTFVSPTYQNKQYAGMVVTGSARLPTAN